MNSNEKDSSITIDYHNQLPVKGQEVVLGVYTPPSRSRRSSHTIHYEGFVRKRGDWLPRWEERYLVLEGITLTYYNSKEDASELRNLRGRMMIQHVNPENHGKAHGFLIETIGHKQFHCCCTSELEKTTWVEMMQSAIVKASIEKKQSTTDDSSSNTPSEPPPIQVNLRAFYNAFRLLLVKDDPSASPQFFSKLSRNIILTSNYTTNVPFWGEYHGLDGVLNFFSIIYETVQVFEFTVTDITQSESKSTAVIAGVETMNIVGKQSSPFTQHWQHNIRFGPDGRITHLSIVANSVAASAAFSNSAGGGAAVPQLSLPINSVSSSTHQPGKVHIYAIKAESLYNPDIIVTDENNFKYFLGFRLAIGNSKISHAPPVSSSHNSAKTELSSNNNNPIWQSRAALNFEGTSSNTPCYVVIEAWGMEIPGSGEELIGVCRVNLAPFLAQGSTSASVRESVVYSEIAAGAVPQWYVLQPPVNDVKNTASVGRVQLSINFIPTSSSSNNTAATIVSASSTVDSEIMCESITPTCCTRKELEELVVASSSFRDYGRNNHQFDVGNTKFDIPTRYEFIKPVGQGAYGCVIAAKDLHLNTKVAIKNIPNAFNDLIDAKRILREIRLMRHLQHPNLVNLENLFRPPSLDSFNDVYIVTELMETDLHRVIHSSQALSAEHIQFFLYQLVLAVKYVHSASVLHRDLKPSNILVNSDCDLKLCDFGLARGVSGIDVEDFTEYVVTRWYRSPELLLSSNYDKPMDVWAIGCIFAELLGRKPLFPGKDYLHQLKIIMQVVGSPNSSSLDFITNPKARRFIERQGNIPKIKSWQKLYPMASTECLDLLDKMLQFNPSDRITLEDALEHKYFANGVRDADTEAIECPIAFNFDFENGEELTKERLRHLMFKDICYFNPEALVEQEQHENDNTTIV